MKNKMLLPLILWVMIAFNMGLAQDIQIHGFISQGAIYSTEYNYISENSQDFSMDLQEMGINFQTDVSDRLHIGMQLLARDVGVYGEGRVAIDWAYGDYYLSDEFKIAFGRVKNRLGFYTTIQDFDFLRTWAVLPSSIYDMGLRTVNSTVDGLQLHGNIDSKIGGDLDYAITYGTMKLGKNSDIGAYVGQLTRYPIESATLKYNLSLNLVYNTPINGLRINGTYNRAEDFEWDPITLTADLSEMGMPVYNYTYQITSDIDWFYAGAQYIYNRLELTAEYNYGTRYITETIAGLPDQILQAIGRTATNEYETNYHGGYLGIAYRINQNFSVGGYYQQYIKDLDMDKDLTENKGHDTAFSLAYYAGYNMVIKAEGHYVEGTAPLSVALNDDLTKKDSWMYGVVKVSYNF